MREEKSTITIKTPQSLGSDKTLKDMEKPAGKVFEAHCSSFVNLHLQTVAGSINIIWFFPKSLTEKLEQLAQTHIAVVKLEGVEEVTVAGRVVFNADVEKRADQITAQGQEVEGQIHTAVQQALQCGSNLCRSPRSS